MTGSVTSMRTREETLALRLAAAGSAFFWSVLFFGVIDLTVPIDELPGFYDSYLLETGWGVLYTFLVAGAFLSLAVRPDMVMPLIQVVLVALCLAVTAVASASFLQLVPAALLVGNAYGFSYIVGGPSRVPTGWYRSGLDPLVALLAVVALVPAGAFAVDMLAGYWEGRPPTDDETFMIDHWPTQAALSLAVPVICLAVAAALRSRWSGSLASALCVTLATTWFGVASVAYPDHAGSAGDLWGRLVIGWGLVFLVAVLAALCFRRGRGQAREWSPPATRRARDSNEPRTAKGSTRPR